MFQVAAGLLSMHSLHKMLVAMVEIMELQLLLHQVVAELDAGLILGRALVPIRSDDTAETLAARVLVQEHRLYPAVLRRFLNGETEELTL